MNKLKETAPERIWLYVKQWLNSGDEEIRWSARIMSDGVEYVRADIAEQQSIIIKQQSKEIQTNAVVINEQAKEMASLRDELTRRNSLDALNKRIDGYFSQS